MLRLEVQGAQLITTFKGHTGKKITLLYFKFYFLILKHLQCS